jgi:hypothetical protein
MRKLLLALEVYQMASLRLHELRLKNEPDYYAERHRDDSMNEFGEALNNYVDKRVDEAIDKHSSGYMHDIDED